MTSRIVWVVISAAAFAAAGCGGSSGGSSSSNPGGGGTAGSVSASGTLVDHESGMPLAGESVGLAPWEPGATAVPQGVTGSDGRFTVSAAQPGEYLLVIGSDSPADASRPTIHDAVTLTGGAQVLVAPTMPAVPGETPNPIESSGRFRLTTLSAAEAACLTYENSVRAQHGYAPVVSDEWLTENNRLNWQRTEATGAVGGAAELTAYNSFTALAIDCQSVVSDDFVLSDSLAAMALRWYAADAGGSPNSAAFELGMFDPRAPLPVPTPSTPWP